jgi:hypothetical protein
MTGSTLSAEQRQALAMLATVGLNGATQSLLNAHGFLASLVAGLVNRGLATIMYGRVRAGGKMIEVTKVRITEAGRVIYSTSFFSKVSPATGAAHAAGTLTRVASVHALFREGR